MTRPRIKPRSPGPLANVWFNVFKRGRSNLFCYFSYVKIKVVEKMCLIEAQPLSTILLAVRMGCVRLFVAGSFIHINLEIFFYMGLVHFLRIEEGLVIEYVHHHHHDHVALVARISLTLSRHSSQSFIAPGRSSGQHPVSSYSCWMYVRAGRPAFAWLCVGVHKSTSLMSSSLLLQQCPACLVRLTWIVFVIEDRWSYSWCLVGCCRQHLFKIARCILV